jgi:hypothetical protein
MFTTPVLAQAVGDVASVNWREPASAPGTWTCIPYQGIGHGQVLDFEPFRVTVRGDQIESARGDPLAGRRQAPRARSGT